MIRSLFIAVLLTFCYFNSVQTVEAVRGLSGACAEQNYTVVENIDLTKYTGRRREERLTTIE